MRTFLHTFDPITSSPASGSTIELTVREIEDAGIKEVLQTPGPALGTWDLLQALITPGTGSPFTFREPLGHAREVKVALSGLFGRFVARAYLERYFGLSVYAHLGKPSITLNRRRRILVKSNGPGDLPDWVACRANLTNLTVAEAKGCHDANGPAAALDRAWKQAQRVNIVARGRSVTVKRIAIATRWGCNAGGASTTKMSVHDPEDQGDEVTQDDLDALYAGLLRRHIASLVGPLCHAALARSLIELTEAESSRRAGALSQEALGILDAVELGAAVRRFAAGDGLVGGVVTRTGPLGEAQVSPADERTLTRLALRPRFVGEERGVIRAAIRDHAPSIPSLGTDIIGEPTGPRRDPSGTWVIDLGTLDTANG